MPADFHSDHDANFQDIRGSHLESILWAGQPSKLAKIHKKIRRQTQDLLDLSTQNPLWVGNTFELGNID